MIKMGIIIVSNPLVKKILKIILVFATVFTIFLAKLFITLYIVVGFGLGGFYIKNRIDYITEFQWWWNKNDDAECIIDLAEVMPFEWDYFVIYYHFYEYKKIKEELAIETDMGDLSESDSRRAMFIRNNKVVFYEDWYFHPSEPQKYTVMPYDGNYLLVKKEDAKFKAFKNKRGYLILEKIE